MPAIHTTRPTLGTRDVGAALRFYVEVLGFDVATTMGDPPNFALLTSPAGGGLGLVQVADPLVTEEYACCYIDVTGVEELHRRCVAAGHPITNPLTRHPWGNHDFVVRDPDGHLIAVGEPGDSGESP
jgi:catechol 2,3-dioxygenase-like lactoylglutathione lyase family enzyme